MQNKLSNQKTNYKELKENILKCDFPDKIKLNDSHYIEDTKLFLKAHFDTLEAYSGKIIVKPFYDRLLEFYKLIKK